MASLLRKINITSAITDGVSPVINKIDLGYGFRMISILSVIFGESINIPPVNIQRFSVIYFLNCFYSFTINFFLTLFAVTAGFNIYRNLSDFSTAIYFASGFFGVTESTLRAYLLYFKRNQIEKLQFSLQIIINHPNFRSFQPTIISRLCRVIVVITLFLFTMYIVAITGNYIATGIKFNTIIEENITSLNNNNTKNISVEILELWSYMEVIFGYVPTSAVSICTAILYVFSFFGVSKLIISDILFYAWYWLVIEELELLARGLDGAVRNSTTLRGRDRLSAWLKFHHSVSRGLRDINSITSPFITVAVIFSTLQMCIITYVAVKQVIDISNSMVLVLFGLMSLQQVFMYCILGQRIREKVSRLQSAAYRAPWLGSRRGTQHAALMICSAATERSMELPGAPFFALSLEFFASIMGAIFTYFIVLLQMKK